MSHEKTVDGKVNFIQWLFAVLFYGGIAYIGWFLYQEGAIEDNAIKSANELITEKLKVFHAETIEQDSDTKGYARRIEWRGDELSIKFIQPPTNSFKRWTVYAQTNNGRYLIIKYCLASFKNKLSDRFYVMDFKPVREKELRENFLKNGNIETYEKVFGALPKDKA